jgi:hypothetical protein
MGHDELCLITGIRPGGGPRDLLYSHGIERVVKDMVHEIKLLVSDPKPSDLLTILEESLAVAIDEKDQSWKPPGLGNWTYFNTCIAIGYFDQHGHCETLYYGHAFEPRALGGRDVECRRVYTDKDSVWFDYVVTGDPYYNHKVESWSDCTTMDGNPNFFVLEGAYRYLEAWLDWESLPPRKIAFPDDAEPMSIASEFYEIVNTRKQPRSKPRLIYSVHAFLDIDTDDDDTPTGILPCIDYGGIEKTCPQYQDDFQGARCGSHWTARGIGEGLRGKDLLPYLMRDFGAWMGMRPDMYEVYIILSSTDCFNGQMANAFSSNRCWL